MLYDLLSRNDQSGSMTRFDFLCIPIIWLAPFSCSFSYPGSLRLFEHSENLTHSLVSFIHF